MPTPHHHPLRRPATPPGISVVIPLLLLAACSLDPSGNQPRPTPSSASVSGAPAAPTSPGADEAAVIGMWMTADGEIRQELLVGGRYEEARGERERAYTGRYSVSGSHLDYVDDTGFTATGDIRDGVLHHGGMELYRQGDPRITGLP